MLALWENIFACILCKGMYRNLFGLFIEYFSVYLKHGKFGYFSLVYSGIIKRPGVAGAVLQTPSSLLIQRVSDPL